MLGNSQKAPAGIFYIVEVAGRSEVAQFDFFYARGDLCNYLVYNEVQKKILLFSRIYSCLMPLA